MAKENIAKFFNAAMSDKTLAGKLAALAKEHGCEFTAAELLKYAEAGSISDKELDKVSGGLAAGQAQRRLFF